MDFEFGELTDHIGERNQAKFLFNYLKGQSAACFIVETGYVDRNYSSDYHKYFSLSSGLHYDFCKRLTFFSTRIDEALLQTLQDPENVDIRNEISGKLLGTIVVRPLPQARIGKTLLRWYHDDQTKINPRIMCRSYRHSFSIGTLNLSIEGIPWQQQDMEVSVCSTVAVWSQLYASANSVHYRTPTVAEITEAAIKNYSTGHRIFPAKGWESGHIGEAIKSSGLEPMDTGDGVALWLSDSQLCALLSDEAGSNVNLSAIDGHDETFNNLGKHALHMLSGKKLNKFLTPFLHLGVPVVLAGNYIVNKDELSQSDGSENLSQHAICVTGYRQSTDLSEYTGNHSIIPNSHHASTYYVHDDNIGPNSRFRFFSKSASLEIKNNGEDDIFTAEYCFLKREPPDGREGAIEEEAQDVIFMPYRAFVAVEKSHRLCPMEVQKIFSDQAIGAMTPFVDKLLRRHGLQYATANGTFCTDFRFYNSSEYMKTQVPTPNNYAYKGQLLLDVAGMMGSMSKTIGVTRLYAVKKHQTSVRVFPFFDIVHDTTTAHPTQSVSTFLIYTTNIEAEKGFVEILKNAFEADEINLPKRYIGLSSVEGSHIRDIS
ncbi:MAG: hypothetical protein AAGA11_11825 [Pseudomonadota bacterium]